jgi:hypothetical protein
MSYIKANKGLMPQDFSSNLHLIKDLPAPSAQPAADKRSRKGEGGGGTPVSRTDSAQPVNIRQCLHTKADGVRCGSPALRGKPLCYFHARPGKAPRANAPTPLPDMRNPLQMLRWAIHNLSTGRIDTKAAGQIIYAVQQLMG